MRLVRYIYLTILLPGSTYPPYSTYTNVISNKDIVIIISNLYFILYGRANRGYNLSRYREESEIQSQDLYNLDIGNITFLRNDQKSRVTILEAIAITISYIRLSYVFPTPRTKIQMQREENLDSFYRGQTLSKEL